MRVCIGYTGEQQLQRRTRLQLDKFLSKHDAHIFSHKILPPFFWFLRQAKPSLAHKQDYFFHVCLLMKDKPWSEDAGIWSLCILFSMGQTQQLLNLFCSLGLSIDFTCSFHGKSHSHNSSLDCVPCGLACHTSPEGHANSSLNFLSFKVPWNSAVYQKRPFLLL